MSVLIEFAMFPTDKGVSVSEDVSRVIEMIRRDYPRYKLTAMGTIVETETLAEALEVIEKAYGVLEPYSERVYSSIKIDIRKSKDDRLEAKVASIKGKIGLVNI
jgi:uncharacterized protein (TIGR00106 family)